MSRFYNILIKTLIVPIAGTILAASTIQAQTLYGIDAVGGLGNPLAVELVGPPAGPCGYPSGPFGLAPFPAAPVVCPGPMPFVSGYPGIDGDIAVNKINDTVWVASDQDVGEYDVHGVQIAGFVNPMAGPITGMGMDTAAGTLWLTEANSYAMYQPLPGCGAALKLGPFPNPHPNLAPMTDISWDPNTFTLWACFADGNIANFAPGGLPTCFFNATGLGTPLTGIAVDTSTPGWTHPNQVLVVTDGPRIARYDAVMSCGAGGGLGVLAANDFAFPLSLYPVASGPLSGLAYSAHHVNFGAGSGPGIRLVGQALPGLPSTSIEMFGALPGVNAYLFINFFALCPPGMLKFQPLHVTPAILVGPMGPHTGQIFLPTVLPAFIGLEVYMQWFSKVGFGMWQSSPGMAITIARP